MKPPIRIILTSTLCGVLVGPLAPAVIELGRLLLSADQYTDWDLWRRSAIPQIFLAGWVLGGPYGLLAGASCGWWLSRRVQRGALGLHLRWHVVAMGAGVGALFPLYFAAGLLLLVPGGHLPDAIGGDVLTFWSGWLWHGMEGALGGALTAWLVTLICGAQLQRPPAAS